MTPPPTIETRDLGRLGYANALKLQRELNQAVIDGTSPPTVLLVEHDPVVTLTRRKSVRDHLLASDEQLAKLGVEAHETDRGGDITYHGPGQLVVYPILKLGDFGLNLSSYMRLLEQAVIDTIAQWAVVGHSECGATGVWVEGAMADGGWRMAEGQAAAVQCGSHSAAQDPAAQASMPESCSAKLCAMGVRIRRNTTMHGLALNVDPDMAHFDLIVPCGLAGRPVTSLRQLLGDKCPSMDEVKDRLSKTLIQQLIKGRNKPQGGQGIATKNECWLLT